VPNRKQWYPYQSWFKVKIHTRIRAAREWLRQERMTTTTPMSARLVILGQISTTMRPLRTELTLIGSLPLARTPSISRTTPNEAGLFAVVSPRRAVGGRRVGHRGEVPQRRIAILDHMLATDPAAHYCCGNMKEKTIDLRARRFAPR
jgi:hypothetical protein